MDWTKAKSILIVALMVTNIILISVYGIKAMEVVDTEQELQTNTLTLLEEKGVFVEGTLPTKHSSMPVLHVEYDRLDSEVLETQLWSQIPIDENDRSRESMLALSDGFLEKCGILTQTVEMKTIKQTGRTTTVTYRNLYEGIAVEDSFIICTIEGGQVVKLERVWLNPIEFGKTKRETMSASAALLDMLSKKNEISTITVKEMEMVYWLDPTNYGSENTVSDTAFPAWKITYNDGQVMHIPAYLE